jgi:uncharacterized membrane protein (DUF106 family)
MLTALNNMVLAIADPVLGWLLCLPTDVTLIVVSLATAVVLTLARPLTTDQDLLRRCREDKRRLRQLIKEARKSKDKEAVRRYKSSLALITMKTLKSEGRPLLLAIAPVAVLAVWCFFRLEFHPPKANETISVHAYFPVSAAGNLVHIVPQDGMTAENGWVQEIVAVTDPAEGPPHGMATWHLHAEAAPKPYLLEIRYRAGTYTKQLLVGQRTYAPAVEFYADGAPVICSEIQMKPVKLFGIVPGIPPLGLAPWLMAYFVIAIPSVPLVKRVVGVY